MQRLRPLGIVPMLALALVACGAPDEGGVDGGARDAATPRDGGSDAAIDAGADPDAAAPRDAGAPTDGATITDAGRQDAGSPDSGPTVGDAGADAGAADAGSDGGGDPVFDVTVRADAACADLYFQPSSIAVPAGTSFTVNWINATGCTDIDIDMGGTVPIVIGLPPGGSHHDTVREWCGSYTGTYVFRAYYAPSFPYYLDVDCSA